MKYEEKWFSEPRTWWVLNQQELLTYEGLNQWQQCKGECSIEVHPGFVSPNPPPFPPLDTVILGSPFIMELSFLESLPLATKREKLNSSAPSLPPTLIPPRTVSVQRG